MITEPEGNIDVDDSLTLALPSRSAKRTISQNEWLSSGDGAYF